MNKLKSTPWDAVIFDYGRVLSASPSREELAVLATLAGVSEDTFFELYSNTRDHYDRGHADCKQHWQRFAEVAKVEIPPEAVEQIVAMESVIWTKPNNETLDLAREIKARGLKIAILSNMPFDLLEELRRKFDWLDEFEVQTWSCDLGVIKPDAAIYQACLTALGCEPRRTLFFDDRPRNVEAARGVGMEAHVFESASQARAIIERGLNLR
ncbi:MAG: HAD family phosphatase [Candidatus Korobacteraceae bacterium]